ncbi:hypothetical protein LY625_11410 [Lysobacter sp. GX 14042]|nr:hypothetical protein [Lysobacter sp. GX 14042]
MHAVANALAVDDLDHALDMGLLELAPCPLCTPACRQSVLDAAAARRFALAARERYRAREARLVHRAAERAARRKPPAPTALPSAAAAALARAKAKAARRP